MTSATVLQQLDHRLERFGDLPELNDAEEHLLRHMLVGAALLPGHAERYRALRRRWERTGRGCGHLAQRSRRKASRMSDQADWSRALRVIS